MVVVFFSFFFFKTTGASVPGERAGGSASSAFGRIGGVRDSPSSSFPKETTKTKKKKKTRDTFENEKGTPPFARDLESSRTTALRVGAKKTVVSLSLSLSLSLSPSNEESRVLCARVSEAAMIARAVLRTTQLFGVPQKVLCASLLKISRRACLSSSSFVVVIRRRRKRRTKKRATKESDDGGVQKPVSRRRRREEEESSGREGSV